MGIPSECLAADSNYAQLKELLGTYRDANLEIALFSCNQFGLKESGIEPDIVSIFYSGFDFECFTFFAFFTDEGKF